MSPLVVYTQHYPMRRGRVSVCIAGSIHPDNQLQPEQLVRYFGYKKNIELSINFCVRVRRRGPICVRRDSWSHVGQSMAFTNVVMELAYGL